MKISIVIKRVSALTKMCENRFWLLFCKSFWGARMFFIQLFVTFLLVSIVAKFNVDSCVLFARLLDSTEIIMVLLL